MQNEKTVNEGGPSQHDCSRCPMANHCPVAVESVGMVIGKGAEAGETENMRHSRSSK